MEKILTIREKIGTPVQARTQNGPVSVTPIVKVAHLQLPGLTGGMIWNRPVGVLVQTAEGSQVRLPVRDVTRYFQVAFLAAGLLGAMILASQVTSRRKQQQQRR